jgi:hypothetical protein
MTDKEVILKIKSGEINYFEFLIKKYLLTSSLSISFFKNKKQR